jgi:hypothetical protein
MNATLDLAKDFEGFAECCLDLARSAETTACRARFIQMAREYRLATSLMHEKLSGRCAHPDRVVTLEEAKASFSRAGDACEAGRS